MATIIPTESGYRAQVYVQKQRASRSFKTKREAVAWASAKETQFQNNIDTQPAVRYTVADALDRYAKEVSPTKRGELFEVKRMVAWKKDKSFPSSLKIGSITPEHLASWRDSRLMTVSAGSVLRDFHLLASVFESARREWRWIETNPVRDVRKPRQPDHREVVISRWKIRKMLESLNYRPGDRCSSVAQSVAAAFLLALRTGMRAKEICELTWSRVYADYCVLEVTKTVPRNVPLEPKAKRIIDNMKGWGDDLVFDLKAQTLDAMFRKYRARAGLEGFTFHDARHTAATWMARKIDILDLCKVFGWTSTKHALVYYNPTASDIAKRLSRTRPGQSQ